MTTSKKYSIKSVLAPIALTLLLAACDTNVTDSGDLDAELAAAAHQAEIDAQVARGLEGHLSFLADDALEGRHPNDASYNVAAAYVASRFKAMGLKPGGNDGSYYQQVPLRVFKWGAAQNQMEIISAEGGHTLTSLEDFYISGNASHTASEATGELVFVGFGVYAPAFGIDDYEGLDLEGKIVVWLGGAPPTLPAEERAHFSDQKTAEASERGAIGAITIRTPAEDAQTSFERRLSGYPSRSGAIWLDGEGNPFTSAANILLSGEINPTISQILFEGALRSYEDVSTESEAGPVKGFALKVSARMQQVSTHEDILSPNIIGIIEGSDPALAQEYLTFTAHLDHHGFGPEINGDDIYNGAADNASGTAVIMEVARSILMEGEPPRRSIAFVVVTAEEQALVGADYFARYPTVPKENIIANINADTVLFFFDFIDVLLLGSGHSSLGTTLEATAADMGLGVSIDPFPEEGFFTRSDHYRFVQQGIPAVFPLVGIGTNEAGDSGMEVFTGYLGTDYHRPTDDMHLPWNYAAGAKFVRFLTTGGARIANADERPTWNEGDFFGDTFAGEAEEEDASGE